MLVDDRAGGPDGDAGARREADVETRYGGRFVQSIEGIEGDVGARADWFYFINGFEGDRSAAEYRLRDGDVDWWDFRSWRAQMRQPVVVGAFPEPFLHGYGGKTRPVVGSLRHGERGAARARPRPPPRRKLGGAGDGSGPARCRICSS